MSVRDYFMVKTACESPRSSFGAEIINVRSDKSNTKNNRKKESFSHSDVYNDGNVEVFHYRYCDWFDLKVVSGRSPFA